MVWTVHLPRTTFSHAQLLRRLVFYCCQSVQSQIDPMHLHDQVTKHIVCGSSKNTHTSSRNVVHLATLDDTTHGHSFLTFSWTSLAASRTTLRRSTTTAEWRFGRAPTPLQVMSPKQLAEDRDYKHFTGDGHFTEHEDLRVNSDSFQKSIMASTCDSTESIATPSSESDSDDEQLRALLASPLYLQERQASAERSQVYHSERRNLMFSFLKIR